MVSPLLANIYLHELDKFMETMKADFDRGKQRRGNPAFQRFSWRIYNLRRDISLLRSEAGMASPEITERLRQIKELDRARKALPGRDPYDVSYRRLYYCRYADDSLVGIIGTKEDAAGIMSQMTRFLKETLNLDSATDKSKISHASVGTLFLGYEIISKTTDKMVKVKRGETYTPSRTVAQRLRLRIPEEKLARFCRERGYRNYVSFQAEHRAALLERSDTEIIMAYNAELRGLANYYSLAYGARSRLHKLYYLWRMSLFKTLADKHKTSVRQIFQKLYQGKDFVHLYEVQGKQRRLKFFTLRDLNPTGDTALTIDQRVSPVFTLSKTEIVQRLNANRCEYCGREEGYFEVHHVRKLSDVADKGPLWKQIMRAMRRKTLVLCIECHDLLHQGKLPDWRRRKDIGWRAG